MKYKYRIELYDPLTGKPNKWRHELWVKREVERYDYIGIDWDCVYSAVTFTKTFPFTPDNLKRYEVED